MWHFDKNKQKNIFKWRFGSFLFYASSVRCFLPHFPPNTQHRDDRIPRISLFVFRTWHEPLGFSVVRIVFKKMAQNLFVCMAKTNSTQQSARSFILRISLGSPRATPIGPSSSTIEARTALATAPLFLTLGLGLVDLAFLAGLVVFLLFFFVLAGACQRHGVDCFNFTIHHQKRFA